MTPWNCINWCGMQGYKYGGVQGGSDCYCGNTYGRYGELPFTACSVTCNGTPNFNCGGTSSNSIYSTQSKSISFFSYVLRFVIWFALLRLTNFVLADQLPSTALPNTHYKAPPRLVVPTIRTSLDANEDFR